MTEQDARERFVERAEHFVGRTRALAHAKKSAAKPPPMAPPVHIYEKEVQDALADLEKAYDVLQRAKMDRELNQPDSEDAAP